MPTAAPTPNMVESLVSSADWIQRLAAQIDRSAQMVAAGRRDLEAVREWVVGAAQSVPKNAAGEQMQVPIVAKGLSHVSGIITRTNGELAAVGGDISTIGAQYQALGEQTFGGGLPESRPTRTRGCRRRDDAPSNTPTNGPETPTTRTALIPTTRTSATAAATAPTSRHR